MTGRRNSPGLELADLNEEAVALGAAILNPEQGRELLDGACEADFSTSRHKAIFRAMAALPLPFDYAQVGAELRRRGELDSVGGYEVIAALGNGVLLHRRMQSRLQALREWRKLRALAQLAEEIASKHLLEPGISSAKLLEIVEG